MDEDGDGGQRLPVEGWHVAVLLVLVIGTLVVANALGLPPFGDGGVPRGGPATPSASAGQGGTAPQVPAPGQTLAPGEPGGPSGTPTGEEVCVEQGSDVAFTVLTFNTFSARRLDAVRMATVAAEIRRWDPDIALLQEVSRNRDASTLADQPAWYADRLGMEWSFAVNDTSGPGEYGVATLSKYPIVGQANTPLPYRAGLNKNFHRGVLNTRIQIDETVISVYNTHLQPGPESLRAAQMRTVAGVLAVDPLPQVLGGDLNSRPETAPLAIARTQLEDSWADSGTGTGLTHPAGRPRTRIDYLLHSPTIRSRKTVTLRSAVSDHLAVMSAYQLDATEEPVCLPVFDDPLQQE